MKATDRSKSPIKVAILSVVKHAYLPRAIAAHPRFQLQFVADHADRPEWTHERNQLIADEFGIPYLRNVQKAIEDHELDAVVVSSEAERHCDLAIIGAEAGLHIVVDKPLSTRLENCDRLIQAIDYSGVKCLVWNRNFLPAIIQAREAVESGKIGKLAALHCDFYFSKDAGPPVGSRKEGDPPINWLDRQLEAHLDGSDGGVGTEPMGELQVEGLYPLAYIRMLTGEARAERVFARTSAHFHQAHADNQVDDLATVTLEMEHGIIASLCIGRIGAAAHPDIGEIKLHLIGDKGAMVISEARPEVAIYYRDQPPTEFKHKRIADENNYLLAENFARSIDGEESPVLDARGARDICATVIAALQSAQCGKSVDVQNLNT
ncbi:MAG: Gfo/Idh/MocA family oxidoreductase [Verrucomicrobia bacterium]|nr:Gfo/Idh/MocA family oxidoreductase [Verrucomicrobiota bacterium]